MIDWIDPWIREAGTTGLLLIGLGALLEYLFPPFPGDSVTVLGGLYAVRGGAPAALVFAVVMAGSLGGALLDFLAGRWVAGRLRRAPPDAWYLRRIPRRSLAAWEERFRRRGVLWLAVNRFFPAIRGPVFFAAGFAGVPAWKVVTFGGLSALAWNALVFGAGYAVGGSAERLSALLAGYGRFAWAALLVLAVTVVFGWLWRRRSREPKRSDHSAQ